MNTHRIAHFRIPVHLINHRPDLVVPLFRDCIVVDARMEFDRDTIAYLALGPNFPEVDEAVAAPWLGLIQTYTKASDGGRDLTKLELKSGEDECVYPE